MPYIFMAGEGIFIFGAHGEGYARVVVKYAVIFAWSWVIELEAIKSGSLVVAKTKPAFSLLIEGELTSAVVGARRGYSLSID